MNILVICHYGLYQNLSASFVHNQAKEFARLGHNVKVIIPIAIGKKDYEKKIFTSLLKSEMVDDVSLEYVRYISLSKYGNEKFNYKSANIFLKLHFKKIFNNFIPDIIHAHTIEFDGRLGISLQNKFDIPLIITSHGSDAIIPVLNGKGNKIRKICDSAATVVTVSNHLKRTLEQCNINTNIIAILNGYNINMNFDNSPKEKYTIIQVGHLIKQKNFDKTINAFAILKKSYPKSVLKIVGVGIEDNNLKKLCRKLQIEDSVVFYGQLDNERVLEEMAKSEVFIMPSEREGFGIVYLEAMANECFTIGTSGEAISEVITTGVNGILIDAHNIIQISNELKRCFDDETYMKNIAYRGRKSVEKLTWAVNAKKYEILFVQEIVKMKQSHELTGMMRKKIT